MTTPRISDAMRPSELALVAAELDAELRNQPIQKIFQPDPTTIVIDLRRHWLLISVDGRFGRMHILSGKPSGTGAEPPSFCMLLRKHLIGARLERIVAVPGERAAELVFRARDSDGHVSLRAFWFGRATQLQLFLHERVVQAIGTAKRNYEALPSPRDDLGPPPRFTTNASASLAALLGEAATTATADAARRAIEVRLQTELGKLERLSTALRGDLDRASRAAQLREHGNLLLAFASHTSNGESSITLTNEMGAGELVTIALEPQLTPVENAQKMFHQARRMERGARSIETRLTQVDADIEHVRARLANLDGEAPAPAMRPPARKQASGKRPPYREYLSARGTAILVGRGAEKNDELTFHVARGNDLWLHSRDAAGAHVVVALDGRPVDEETLLDAATLAAHFSSLRGEAQVDISYTQRKFVKKPPKSRPGSVTHAGGKTIRVRMEPARLQRLLATLREA